MPKILVVEDEKTIRDSIVDMLEFEHYTVDAAQDGLEALERLRSGQFDLVILDWGLPQLEGVEVLRKFRISGGTTPVLMLTGNSKISSKVEGLESGADDYLTKPFDMRELTARVRAILKRPHDLKKPEIIVRDLTIDTDRYICTRDGTEIRLLPKEFNLLVFLARNDGRVYGATDLLERVWGTDLEASEDAVRQCIKRLRGKIDVDGQPSYITTVVGVGYKIASQSK